MFRSVLPKSTKGAVGQRSQNEQTNVFAQSKRSGAELTYMDNATGSALTCGDRSCAQMHVHLACLRSSAQHVRENIV